MDKPSLKNFVRYVFFFLFLFNVQEVFGLELYHSSRSVGQACSVSADPYAVLSRYNNPAGAGWNTDFALAVDYYRRFDLKELDCYNFLIFKPFNHYSSSLHGYRFGGDLYSMQSISASISRVLFSRLSTGIQIGKEQVQLKNYGNETRDFMEVGILGYFDRVSVGCHTINLFSTKFLRFSRDDSFAYRVSLQYKPNRLVELNGESIVYSKTDPDFAFGVSSQLTKRLQIRMGYNTAIETIHVGLGISLNDLGFDGGFYHHPDLGWSQAYGMRLGLIDENRN